MKKVVLSNRGANVINTLRGDIGGYEAEKENIADTLCGLVDMMHFGIDNNDVTPFTNDIFKAMTMISAYNDMINNLNDTVDWKDAEFGLVQQAESSSASGDCVFTEDAWPRVCKVLERHGVDASPLSYLSHTAIELAQMCGIPMVAFRSEVSQLLVDDIKRGESGV